MRSLSDIKSKIFSLKKKLSNELVMVENFGEKEIRKIDDFIGDIWEYPYSQRQKIISLTNKFCDWCATYCC